MTESRMKRRTINNRRNRNEVRYFDFILIGIISQIIVLIGSLNTIHMNGTLSLLILMFGDTCLACGIDYYQSKKQAKNKRKK